MANPARVPTQLNILRGNPSKKAIPKREMQPLVETEVRDPPPHITGTAREEWFRLGNELLRLRCLTVLDYSLMGTYCTHVQKWVEAEEMLAELRNAKGRATLVDSPRGAQINPLIRASLLASDAMVRVAGEFGFSPAARARVAMGIDAQEDFGKFNGLIAG